jgi:phage-related minor tail protein
MKTSSFTDFDSQVESQCKPLSTKAALCCATPEKCIKEAIGGMGGASAQFAIQALQFIGTGAIAISAGGGAAKICETTGAVAAGGAALSTAMAGLCGKKVDQCVKTCGNIKDDIESAIASCSSGKSEPSQINACRDMYKDALKRANNHINDCQRADVATVEKGASAMGALMAAKMADYCKQQTTAGTTPGLQQNLFNIDCTSAGAATNPICQNPCMRDATSQECMNQIAAMGQNPNGGMGGPGVLIIWAGRSQ